MNRDEIFEKVKEVLVDALGVDDDEVTPDASLTADLGAESIDFLDIVFKLEQAFGFKIPQGELFPENVMDNPEFVQDGRVTDAGLAALKERLPHADFTRFESDREVTKVAEVFTVDAVVNFVERKLAGVQA
ncbi:MAG: acyl carrier protein [Planctomycetota bacterium]|nr:MAG: acyl carrier protein [Planctomycetota bacterium]